ncbi:MAG TPA: lactonase family protein [Planctomycetota bacterium]|jgi:6-phosphogluconolactonase|nr:lactonase family protein [Planctomycetota bacterium]OQC19887.1 MAG: 6-phosphogluconolactonase [Planctomycetes bacterium ADurb.Bin069]HNR98382.1 lactonase family protein [Planctomycetota bacterium]HNU26271.1 lactonase family protein [Planctomycetota bacterium]HOE28906.1 lactonase family protein [Planctomycetota bacterium]
MNGSPALPWVLLAAFAALSGSILPAAETSGAPPAAAGKLTVYVGTYTGGKSEGIYRFLFDPATGSASAAALAAKTDNPSFLALHPGGRFLYAVNEAAGAMSAFRFANAEGDLEFLNRESTGGAAPCHVAVDRAGKHAFAANYTSGSIALLPIGADGRLGARTALIAHEGSGADRSRQKGPHAHCVDLDAANKFLLVADLGIDRIVVYRFDAAAGTLAPHGRAALAPGAGPRHLAFAPDERRVYAINELDLTVTRFDYTPATGALQAKETLSTLPVPRQAGFSGGEIAMHPSGRFLYASNRGHDSIAAFAVDGETGALRVIGHTPAGGRTPRHFALDPGGDWLLCAHQDSDTIAVFRVDRATGRLAPADGVITVPAPVCILFRSRLPAP